MTITSVVFGVGTSEIGWDEGNWSVRTFVLFMGKSSFGVRMAFLKQEMTVLILWIRLLFLEQVPVAL
jgi:hypothetical protein